MKILLISLQGIGNTILITPAVKYLCEQGNIVDAITSNNGSSNILSALGIIKSIYIYHEEDNFLKNAFRIKKEIKNNYYDIVYAMYPNGRRENLLSYLLNKKAKTATKSKMGYWKTFRFFSDEKTVIEKDTHDIAANLKLVGAGNSYRNYRPAIIIPDNIEKEIISKYFFDSNNKEQLVVLHPLSSQKVKCWNLDNYKYICQRLIKEKQAKVVVAGSTKESNIIDALVDSIGQGVEKFTPDNILSTAAMIKHSILFIGNDSSLMHISASLDKATIAIWGLCDYKRTSPYGENSLIIRKTLECSPCYSFEYGYNKKCLKNFDCLGGLNKEKVYDIISLVFDKIKEGKNIKDLDFSLLNNTGTVQTLWSQCKMVAV